MEMFTQRAHERLDPNILSNLLSVSGGDRSFVASQVGLYKTRAEKLIVQLTIARSELDMKKGAASAHALAGSSAMIGANVLRFLCLSAETCAVNGQFHRFQRLVERIVREYVRLQPELEKQMSTLLILGSK